MSFARPVLTPIARSANTPCITQRKIASTVAHQQHEHKNSNDQYHREDFSSPIWRNTLIASLLIVAAYKYAPTPGDGTYLTRWIAFYKTPRETWLEINAVHTAKQQEASAYNILLSDARKEPAHRYRYPQILDQASPFLNGVGM
ncbi:hypothetical protein AX15_007083 [Amanita polypyramis BW_CC]|nr:hypothetical protein AX15_007083 [Amanita polypyramis BW_CC]